MHSQNSRNFHVPLALAAGGKTVRTVTSFLVELRGVYQDTQMHNEQLCHTIKYDVHECILKFLKCMTWQFAKLNKQASQTNKRLI